MGNPDYTISSSLTGDMGEALFDILTPEQAQLVSGLVDIQRPYLEEIVSSREDVSIELRRFMSGESADQAAVLTLMEKYGQADGSIVYNFAVNFSQVNQMLSDAQKEQLMALRQQMLSDDFLYPAGAYLYSQPIDMPDIPNTDFLFR